MSEYGIKIKNIQAGTLYEHNLGVRDYFSYKNAMFTNNLLGYFLKNNGLKINKDRTRDIICINFDFGSQSYKENNNRLNKLIDAEGKKIKECKTDNDKVKIQEKINNLIEIQKKNELVKDKFDKKTKEQLRTMFYEDGINVTYITKDKDGNIKKQETIHYKMLYRSTGKAKNGSCIFICNKLYKKAKNFIYMGLKLPKEKSPIIEIGAYSSVITSTIVDTIKINPKNILVLKDIDEFFKTKVISIETDENKHCIAKTIEDYQVKNTLFDGQGLIDADICPDWIRGYALLRQHMCKMACFKSYLQRFFKDYYGENYLTAKVKDMWGNEHFVKDIELITTDNAMKWLKFDVSYDYWCDRVYEIDCLFGIVKTSHKSKLGNVQKMSYQMVNSLNSSIMNNVVKLSKEYIEKMKSDNNVFLQYLKDNSNFANDYDVLVALCEQNWDFTRSEYFRERKWVIIQSYINNFRTGKIIQNADNLVIVGSPYAMLLHAVGDNIKKDNTFKIEIDTIQCFTTRFKDNEYLACFRSPFNSKNNMGYLHNTYDDKMIRYFDFSDEIIAVNMIGTDFQDRNNGSDQDSDFLYCTNQSDIANFAKECYLNYPTIVNNIPKEKNTYDNTLFNFAYIDNKLALAQMAIGESSNLAQLALTYSYNFKDQKYSDYVCILSVLAQVAIDNAKRKFDIDINNEIRRIKSDMDIVKNGYPLFWKYIKKDFNSDKINTKLKCPVNYLCKLKFVDSRSDESTLSMEYFFNKFEMKENKIKSKKVENLIQKYSLMQYEYNIKDEEDDDNEYLLLKNDFDKLINDIQSMYISTNHLGLMSWLLDRAFILTPNIKSNKNNIKTKIDTNKSLLLKILYQINPKGLLKCFSKNA